MELFCLPFARFRCLINGKPDKSLAYPVYIPCGFNLRHGSAFNFFPLHLKLSNVRTYVRTYSFYHWVDNVNRAVARSGHIVRNKLCWDANNAVGLPKQRNSYHSIPTIPCFESPTALFASPTSFPGLFLGTRLCVTASFIPYHVTGLCLFAGDPLEIL